MTVIVKHNKTNSITDWTQAQLNEQIALGNFAPGTTLANIVLPSDWNNDHTLTGLGTMAEQDATAVAITGGTATLSSVTTPSVTAPTNNLTLSAISTGAVRFNTLGGLQAQVTDQTSADLVWTMKGGSSSLAARATLGTNSGAPNFYATGGTIIFTTNGANNADALRITHTASAVNYVNVAGAATTKEPIISVAGSDSDISMAFQPKGTGAIDLAAGSSGVNISNGGTVTAITRTVAGTGYTSPPTVAITAPTTAGGVQATVSAFLQLAVTPTITSGGTGYTVGNVLTFVGGTIGLGANASQVTVTSVSSGVITGISITTFGTGYSVVPTNPISVTGGSGSGATFTVSGWQIAGFTITNAGSGYIEQPTITFSGGGGSGAAAYATVGSDPIVRSIGSVLKFFTPNGETLRLLNSGVANANYVGISGGGTGSRALVRSEGSDTNIDLSLLSTGTGSINFATNGASGNIQARVSNTASAVNYVQVTGAATSGSPIISSQGSDANTPLVVQSKGTGSLFVKTIGSNAQVILQSNSLDVARFNASGSAVNYFQLTSSAATFSPALSAAGTDTNIDLSLTPKGTGLVRFGTYVAGALLATGYINIKAADGTTYKVLVST